MLEIFSGRSSVVSVFRFFDRADSILRHYKCSKNEFINQGRSSKCFKVRLCFSIKHIIFGKSLRSVLNTAKRPYFLSLERSSDITNLGLVHFKVSRSMSDSEFEMISLNELEVKKCNFSVLKIFCRVAS